VWEFFFFYFSTKKFFLKRTRSGTPWVRRNRPFELCPRPTKSHWFGRKTLRPQPQNSSCIVFTPRTQSSPIKSTWFFGHGQSSDARYLFNQDVSDLDLRKFPLTFQGKFFSTKIQKIPDPSIKSIRIIYICRNQMKFRSSQWRKCEGRGMD
jgi:hypothetical protein